MGAITIGRVNDLRAARRRLKLIAAAMMLVPGVLAALEGGSVQELIVPVLPLIPLIVLVLIIAGALGAAARDVERERETPAEFPRPLELRG